MRMKGNFSLLCFHVANLRVHVETSRGVTSRSFLVVDESATVSERVETRRSLDSLHEHSPSLVVTRSVVTAAFKQLVAQFGMLGGNYAESAAESWQHSEPKLAKESHRRVCRNISVEPDNERHRSIT